MRQYHAQKTGSGQHTLRHSSKRFRHSGGGTAISRLERPESKPQPRFGAILGVISAGRQTRPKTGVQLRQYATIWRGPAVALGQKCGSGQHSRKQFTNLKRVTAERHRLPDSCPRNGHMNGKSVFQGEVDSPPSPRPLDHISQLFHPRLNSQNIDARG